LFEAITDSINAFYFEAGGWSQPSFFNPITAPLIVSVVGNLPPLTDALSKPRFSLCRQIYYVTMCLTAGFLVQLFFIWRIFKFSKLYFGIKAGAILFAICIFIFLVSFPLINYINSDPTSNPVILKVSLVELATGLAFTDLVS
jgi:hypothetical protein